MFWLWIIILLQYCMYVENKEMNNSVKCHRNCLCNDTGFAICSGFGLNYVPRFPHYIHAVTMTHTNLSYVGKFGFYNLTYNFIERLNLTENSVQYIDPNAFLNLTGLKKLTISKEIYLNFSTLAQSLLYMKKQDLKRVFFTDNDWKYLPTDLFVSFNNSGLAHLYLYGNLLSNVNCDVFSSLSNLKTLDLSNNRIERITLSGIRWIRYLILVRNKISNLPEYCNGQNSLVPFLRILKISENNIGDIKDTSFRCLDRLEALWIENLHIYKIRSNIVANLPALKRLYMRKIGTRLKVIEDFAFNSSSLEYLTLTFTHFAFHGRSYNPRTIFLYSPNLVHLDLSGNDLRGTDSQLRIMSQYLRNIQNLILSQTRMLNPPIGVFTKMNFLQRLILNGNKISHWNDSNSIFGNSSLRYLNLRANRISVINETSFSPRLLASLQSLDLSFNQFACTCEQLWFRTWITRTNISLVGYPKSYKCTTPNDMKGILLKDYRPTKENCTHLNPLIIMAIVVSSSTIFVIGLCAIFVNCQTNIKNRLYLLRVFYNRRQGYERFSNTDDFEYHAFVVYCEADREWVHRKFLKKVEEQGLKLCVHHRDFDVGETITGNVDNYLRKCWKVVVVMSNNFAKSEWCQWEVEVVQERRRRQGRDVFLLIMLKNINSKHMTSQLRALLDSAPHLRYKSGIGEDIFWKAAIETLRKPLGHPPVAVL